MILDTNALSDFLAENKAVGRLVKTAPFIGLPVIVLGEYFFGLKNSSRRHLLLPKLERLILDAHVLDISVETVPHYAEIRIELKTQGRPIPENDLWIAALARQHDLPVLTRDAHFDAVRGLTRISW